MRAILFVVTATLCVAISVAYPDGAPVEACETMTPQHEVDPQSTPSPYSVSVNPNKVTPGGKVIVRISKNLDDDYFEGYFVQARNSDNKAVGIFEVDDDYQVINCPNNVGGGLQNAATHNRHEHFSSVEMVWLAPSTPVELNFTFSVVRGKSTFWTGVTVPLSVSEE